MSSGSAGAEAIDIQRQFSLLVAGRLGKMSLVNCPAVNWNRSGFSAVMMVVSLPMVVRFFSSIGYMLIQYSGWPAAGLVSGRVFLLHGVERQQRALAADRRELDFELLNQRFALHPPDLVQSFTLNHFGKN